MGVTASSNTTAVGIGASNDKWVSSSNLIWGAWGGSVGSWIVLTNYLGAQLLLSCTGSQSIYLQHADVVFSPTGTFHNFSTTAYPTTTDPSITLAHSDFGAPIASISPWTYGSGKLHVLHSANGASTRIVICYAGMTNGIAMIDSSLTAQAGVTWATTPHQACWLASSNSSVATVSNVLQSSQYHSIFGGVDASMSVSLEQYGGTANATTRTTPSSTTNAWLLAPLLGLWTTGGKIAMPSSSGLSVLPDVLVGSTTNPTGSTYLSASGEAAWAQFGCVVLPWNNSSVLVA